MTYKVFVTAFDYGWRRLAGTTIEIDEVDFSCSFTMDKHARKAILEKIPSGVKDVHIFMTLGSEPSSEEARGRHYAQGGPNVESWIIPR